MRLTKRNLAFIVLLGLAAAAILGVPVNMDGLLTLAWIVIFLVLMDII